MSVKLKAIFLFLMISALIFGFLHLFTSGSGHPYPYERLHIFLFNLCSGGTIILYFTEKQKSLSARTLSFLILSILYTLLTFYKYYIPAMIISIALAFIVETIRIKRFSLFPIGFFMKTEPVADKFHQASLLCMSIGLQISSLVILNNEYMKWIFMPKLQLDTFFLGFSFPLSLITFSVIFSFMEKNLDKAAMAMKETGFWVINLCVIIFFIFIIFEKPIPQILVALTLFCAVIMILYLFFRHGDIMQQKTFLYSGMFFLIVAAITGIAYIFIEFSPNYTSENYKWLLRLHSFASLYGWNICGLAVICRFNDFPLKLHSGRIIMLHWLTVIVLAPLGNMNLFLAVCAVFCYAVFLYSLFFSITGQGFSNQTRKNIVK